MSTDAPARAAANLATTQTIYAAFGRGDIPTILDLLSENIQWEPWADSFAQRADVPWLRSLTGRERVAGFFSIVGSWEISEFTVNDLTASDHQVAAEIVIDAKLPNGGRFHDEEIHLWTFDTAGKITRLRHYCDTAKHIAVAGGKDTTNR